MADYGFSVSTLQSSPFKHLIIENQVLSQAPSKTLSKSISPKPESQQLHIYLHGDGQVWQQGSRISRDPTPKKSLMLELMAMDDTPSLLLGRPCYFQRQLTSADDTCNPLYWTSARYHRSVVLSLKRVVTQYHSLGYKEIWLMGFSGGGTLATLISQLAVEDISEGDDKLITGVVSLAANLDTKAWAKSQGAEGLLQHSLNPMDQASNSRVVYYHFEGLHDTNVYSHTTDRFKQAHARDNWYRLPIDHSCCWQQYWPSILSLIHNPKTPFPPLDDQKP